MLFTTFYDWIANFSAILNPGFAAMGELQVHMYVHAIHDGYGSRRFDVYVGGGNVSSVAIYMILVIRS